MNAELQKSIIEKNNEIDATRDHAKPRSDPSGRELPGSAFLFESMRIVSGWSVVEYADLLTTTRQRIWSIRSGSMKVSKHMHRKLQVLADEMATGTPWDRISVAEAFAEAESIGCEDIVARMEITTLAFRIFSK